MPSRFLDWFKPPVFEDPEKTRHAKTILALLIFLLVVLFCWLLVPLNIQEGARITIGIGVLGIILIFYFMVKAGKISYVSNSLTFILWMVVLGSMSALGGLRNSGFSATLLVIVIASLTISTRAGIIYSVMTILACALLGIAEYNGLLPVYKFEPISTILVSNTLSILGILLLLIVTLTEVKKGLRSFRQAEEIVEDAYTKLEQNRIDLEQKTLALEKRNTDFQMLDEMSRYLTQSQSETELLEKAVQVIAEKSNADHVGIYLADELEENLILSAFSHPSENKYLAEWQSLKILDNTLGFALPQVETITYRKGDQIHYVSTPNSLTEGGANLSVPILIGDQLVGLINIQSKTTDHFLIGAESIGLAIHVIAISLENFRLHEKQTQTLREISHLASKSTQEDWNRFSKGASVGYQFDQLRILPSGEQFPEEVYNNLVGQKSSSYQTSGIEPRSRLVAPLTLRDIVIGVIGYENANPHHNWMQSEINFLETIASRVSLALENSRLVAEAEQRAERERIIGQITSRMRETHDFEIVLQTAIQELYHSFELKEAEIRLQPMAPESGGTEFEPDTFKSDTE